jgi:hypothetical protein
MHRALADALLVQVRNRIAEGDHPSTPALPIEQLEDLADTLGARLARALDALGHLDRARRVSERDQRPVPHWVIVEVCGVLSALADSEPAGRDQEAQP